MIAPATLVTELKAQVLRLEDDLRSRVETQPDVKRTWQDEHRNASTADRTASSWVAWRDDRVTQAAVAWVLTTVFVRFCEDNQLLTPVWIAGPRERRQEALDAQLAYFRRNPTETDREWLMQAVQHLQATPSTRNLVDAHSALWTVSPSGNAVTALLTYWRERDDTGELRRDLLDQDLSSRFLGDLYEELSVSAKEKFALRQTPDFVEEFILDQTLEPALAERPLDGFRMIDPACGSGHFLLGAFPRLLARWEKHAPRLDIRERVQRCLDALNGVDLNPFAVAISRFRLTLVAMHAIGERSLENAPDFRYHVLTGDSLLHGHANVQLDYGADEQGATGFAYAIEDLDELQEILHPGRYDVVVGNPPYITVADKALNQTYRTLYATCKGTYQLTIPFMELFFLLAKSRIGEAPAGWTGQITSNGFMKREFGSKVIEDFLAHKDLRLVVDTSGANIPGHGTPTVILVGKNQPPTADIVRAVLGIRGEPAGLEVPSQGLVWRSIIDHLDDPGHEDMWTSTVDLDRAALRTHPWSLSGGAAVELAERLGAASRQSLGKVIAEAGFGAVTREDNAYILGGEFLRRKGVPIGQQRPLVEGEVVRDWRVSYPTLSLWPYDESSLEANDPQEVRRILWPLRARLRSRVAYGLSQIERGLEWFEYSMFFKNRYRVPLSITFAFVATHNHFVLDRGGKVFKQTAPIIKLPVGAPEDDHLGLLAVLNSSTACFWLKQNCFNKGSGEQPWADRYEFNSTTVQDLPLPARLPFHRGQHIDALAVARAQHEPSGDGRSPSAEGLALARDRSRSIAAQMVAQQEELDWETYALYGLTLGDLTYSGGDLPGIALGQRAFEIVLARKVIDGEEETAWFERHGSTPITDIPSDWPPAYRELVQKRIDLIESDRFIGLLERPEYKRRWATEPWEKRQEAALRGWLLDRLEDQAFWFDRAGRPTPTSVSQLADRVGRDADLVSVLALWEGRPDVPMVQSLTRLLADEAVPYLAAMRLKEPGLRKYEAWLETWALQRREDAGEKVGPIPVPPNYTSADFVRASYWQARGKLDVSKERFILYPDAGRPTDPTPVLGWAGWDHAQQSLALATLISVRESEGVDDERLVPLVAGLAELQPWVEQWHAEVDPAYGISPAVYFREELNRRARQVNRSLDQLHEWRPAAPTRGRKARA